MGEGSLDPLAQAEPVEQAIPGDELLESRQAGTRADARAGREGQVARHCLAVEIELAGVLERVRIDVRCAEAQMQQ